MLPIKIINRSANKYQLAKHNVTDTTKYKDWLFIYPLKQGNLPPGVNLPQIKKCCSKQRNPVFRKRTNILNLQTIAFMLKAKQGGYEC